MSGVCYKEEPRIGVFVCHCGINIGGVVNVPEVVEYVKEMPNVVYAEENMFTCSSEGIKRIKESINEHDLNRVIVASCTPRTHEPLFRGACEEAGLNKYLFQMSNIREHCSWVHSNEPKKATEKAKDLLRMAVAKARLLEPQEDLEVEVKPSSLVIGAGISGMTASICLANQGFNVFLIEKKAEIGGMLRELHQLHPTGQNSSEILSPIVETVKHHENIKVFTSTTVKEVKGYIGNFEVTALKEDGQEIGVKVGTIIVATGSIEFEPVGLHGYGEYKSVVTQLQLEGLLMEGLPGKPNSVAMIQCVGAMEEKGRTYCSRICCMIAVKNAMLIKKIYPETEVYILYRDLQTYGRENEDYYRRARERFVNFVKYLPERPPEVISKPAGKLVVKVYDALLGNEIEIESDLVVLSTPLIQHGSGKELSSILKVPLGPNGFFLEAHPKLRPVDFATDGIYVCGTAHSPKNVTESMDQAYAAASRAAIPMSKRRVKAEATTAVVDEYLCRGCGKCEEVCEFNAIKVEEVKQYTYMPRLVAKVNEVLCKGCGTCAVICPTGAITMKHFKNEQIEAMIEAALVGG